MKYIRPLLLVLLLVGCNSQSEQKEQKIPDSFTGKVVGVKDGDTIEVFYDGQAYTIRLANVDCPEKVQAFGQAAKKFTSAFCFGKEVTVTTRGTDQYKRLIGIVTVGGVSLNRELVKNGYAWCYTKYSDDAELPVLETLARNNKLGLWADEQPIPPWNFRKERKRRQQEPNAFARPRNRTVLAMVG